MTSSIQADMLPSIYPAFPEHPEFDIFASMDPAKEVGDDFYDFFLGKWPLHTRLHHTACHASGKTILTYDGLDRVTNRNLKVYVIL